MIDYLALSMKLRREADSNDPRLLRHVVLDARLAIEEVAFERLRVVNKKYLEEEIEKWRPKDVMEFLISEIDENVARSFTLSVSRTPIDEDNPPKSAEEFQGFEYEKIGEQAGLDVKRLNKIWHSLSSFLHANHKGYGTLNSEKAKSSVLRAADFLAELGSGNLLMVGSFGTFRFECNCGRPFWKKPSLITVNRVFHCPRKGCMESYLVVDTSEAPIIERRISTFSCHCGELIEVPLRYVDEMRGKEQVNFSCKCGRDGFIKHGKSVVMMQRD